MIRHGGLIALQVDGAWRGVMIEGPSGAGKSDLALRAMAYGFQLVADDRVLLWTSGDRLYGRAPDVLAGKIEVRGLGVMPAPRRPFCEVCLLVHFGASERMPDLTTETILGISVRLLTVDPFENTAPLKLALALTPFDVAAKRRI